jgi:calcineurin-like phosphoesterase family protein
MEEKRIWFTSDTHFYHDKEFLWGGRGFNSTEEMVEKLIQNWNSVVKPDDEVYHLGDVVLSDTEKGIEALKRLNGKIHIIRGNHDTDRRAAAYLECPNVIDVQWATMIKYKKRMFYLTHFYAVAKTPVDGENKQGIIVLHGHTHQTTNFTNNNYFVYHVGADSHNLFPVSIEQIIEDIKNKKDELNREGFKNV